MNEEHPRRAISTPIVLVLAWSAVGIPLLWGIAETVGKTFALFH
jgi:hypothetical protein